MFPHPAITAALVHERQADLRRQAPTRRHPPSDVETPSGMRRLVDRIAHRLSTMAGFHRPDPETSTARLNDQPC
ncbi:MAG: hypothetical protein ABJA74_01920 [Lapillicoccus sp.]